MRPRVIGLLAAAFLVLAPSHAAANGQTICVVQAPSPGPTGCTETQPDLQSALDRAETFPNLDTVKIGAGTFTAAGGQYAYDGGGSDNPVEIVGAGQGATKLVKIGVGAVLEVKSTSPSRVADLTVVPSPGIAGSGGAPDVRSAGIRANNAFLVRVSVDPSSATNLVDGFDLAVGRLTAVTAVLPAGQGSTNVGARFTGNDATVDGATLAGGTGLDLSGTASVSRSRITASARGIRAMRDLTLFNSTIRMTPAVTGQAGIYMDPFQNMALYTWHVTIVGNNAGSSAGLQTSVNAVGGSVTASLYLRNSIVRGFAFTFVRQGFGPPPPAVNGSRTDITAEHSDFAPTVAENTTTGTYTADATNLNVDPAFVDAASGDYRLSSGSPVIDRGSPGALIFGDEIDLAGNPRIVDGNGDGTALRDMGAFEFQPPPPAPTAPPDQGSVIPPGSTTEPGGGAGAGAGTATLTALRLAPRSFLAATSGAAVTESATKPGALVTFTLTRPGTAAFRIERRTTGRRSKGKCVKATRKNRRARKCTLYLAVKNSAFNREGIAGASSFRLTGRVGKKALAPGRYRLIGSSGAAQKTAAFTVKRPPRKRRR